MSLRDAFTALLLLVGGVSAVIVSPPTNVRVSCESINVSVRWDYRTEESQTVFRGNIHPGNCTFETTAHQHDLSNCIWKQEERYLMFMYVTVAAIRGGNQSTSVSSNTFSFNRLKTVHTKCYLDFPSVELKVDELKGTVSFKNPLYLYQKLKQVNTDAEFAFTVSTAQGDFKASCSNEETCKCDVSFHEGAEKCVTLKGMLFFGIGTEQMEFRKTHKICDHHHHQPRDFQEMVLAAILLAVVFLVILVLIACICKVQAWTMKTLKPVPKSLRTNEGGQPLVYKHPARPEISSVHVCDPHISLPLSSEYTDHSEDLQDSNEPEMEDAGLNSDRNSTDDDSADDSVKTECVSVEEEVSPYDCPHVLRVDMGDGDMVTGYTGN